MRLFFHFFLTCVILISFSGQANVFCHCEVRVANPLPGLTKPEAKLLSQFKASYQGDFALESQKQCLIDCRENVWSRYPTATLDEMLRPWLIQLLDQQVVGKNCTGETTLKIPLRVRARLNQHAIGNALDIIHITHIKRSCGNES